MLTSSALLHARALNLFSRSSSLSLVLSLSLSLIHVAHGAITKRALDVFCCLSLSRALSLALPRSILNSRALPLSHSRALSLSLSLSLVLSFSCTLSISFAPLSLASPSHSCQGSYETLQLLQLLQLLRVFSRLAVCDSPCFKLCFRLVSSVSSCVTGLFQVFQVLIPRFQVVFQVTDKIVHLLFFTIFL